NADVLDQAPRLLQGHVRAGAEASKRGVNRTSGDRSAGYLVLRPGALRLAAGVLDQCELGARERLLLEGCEGTAASGQDADLDRRSCGWRGWGAGASGENQRQRDREGHSARLKSAPPQAGYHFGLLVNRALPRYAYAHAGRTDIIYYLLKKLWARANFGFRS